jgi:hypothetical protein
MNLPVACTSSAVFERLMECLPVECFPAVIVHCLGDAVAALARAAMDGTGVTLLSAPGAALYAGCGWWQALVSQARAAHPEVPCMDILDCADATGQAMAALRIGLPRLVLWPNAPSRDAVVAIAHSMGGFVLEAAPTVHLSLTRSRPVRGSASRSLDGSGEGAASNDDKRRAPG